MAVVITVAQQKGGVGKTTLAAQLAVVWAQNTATAIIDIDPQKSLSTWYKVRRSIQGIKKDDQLFLSEIPGWKLGLELSHIEKRFKFVIIDSPSCTEIDTRAAIRVGNLIIIPIQPSSLDLWATQATLELAKKERRKVLVVVNRLPPRGKLPSIIISAIREIGLPLAATTLGNRVAFSDSMMLGKGVVEVKQDSLAAKEITALANELVSLIE